MIGSISTNIVSKIIYDKELWQISNTYILGFTVVKYPYEGALFPLFQVTFYAWFWVTCMYINLALIVNLKCVT